ncbi:MAG: hypothetical protein ACI4Q6_05340 [Huintestinicola sp.]
MEHSIIFPLPFSIHVGFVIVSVILLILCYIRRKYLYELYMLIGVVSTMFVYVAIESKVTFYILGLEEIILLILTIIEMAKVSKKNEEAEKAAAAAAENAETVKAEMPEISAPTNENEEE